MSMEQRNFPALGEETTDVNFFVVRITYGPGNRDQVEVFRNPASLIDEKACVVDAELFGNFAFDRIGIGNFHGAKIHEVDEIRVGTTFRAVTGRRGRGPDRLMPRPTVMHEQRPSVWPLVDNNTLALLSATPAYTRGSVELR